MGELELLGGAFLALLVASSRRKVTPPELPPAPPSSGDDAVLAGLTPDTATFVRAVLVEARLAGLACKLVSGKRTCAQQNDLYASGRTKPGPIVTKARGCLSWHVQGRAVDVAIAKGSSSSYAKLGELAKAHGGKWGGDFPGFPDVGHIEYHPGLTIEQVCPDPDHCLLASSSCRRERKRREQEAAHRPGDRVDERREDRPAAAP